MRQIILLFIIIGFANTVFSQASINGSIRDTALAKGLREASIVLIKKSDSSLAAFTRTNELGIFQMSIPDTGLYKLLYTHPNYADYSEEIRIGAKNENIPARNIYMTTRLRMLKEVIISGRGSMRIKGDTTVYIADSFKVSEGANVEELLKLLPGIEVSKDGSIKAQGQTVQKVLVDGDEFFGDDPTVATQNLESKVVDRVEVFDKKSDQAELTGFDDGEKTKTINLKLKKGMNKGMFGKIETGANPHLQNNNKVMINQFEDKRKIAGYGIIGNTYDIHLNWNDASKYGGDDIEMDDDGNMYRYSYDDGSDGGNADEGLPAHIQGSVSFSDKWDDDKLKVNASAAYKKKDIIRHNTGNTQTVYSNDTVENSSIEDIYATRAQPSGVARFEWKPDTTLTLRGGLNLSHDQLEKRSVASLVNRRQGDDTLSSSTRNLYANSAKTNMKADITVMKKLKRKGRSFSLAETYTLGNQRGRNELTANNVLESQHQLQDQVSTMITSSASTHTRLVYTEPLLGQKVLMEANYSFSYKTGEQDFSTYAPDSNHEEYNVAIDSLTNHFLTDVSTHRGGLRFRLQQKKYNLSIGMDVANARFVQQNLSNGINYDYSRLNIFPLLSMSYKFTSSSNLSINYSGSTQQPTLAQQQPITNNNNPLNIVKGNPALKQEYNQSVNINFWDYKMITERSFWIGGYVSNTIQNISNTYTYDATYGRNITSYTNLNGVLYGTMWAGVRRKLNTVWSGGIDFDMNMGRTPYMQEAQKLFQNNYGLSFRPNIRYYLENKFSVSLDMAVGRQYNKVGSNNWTAYWTSQPELELKFSPLKRMRFSTEISLDYRQKTPPFRTDFKRLYWHANAEADLNKKRNLIWTFTVRNILNQHYGYSRNFYGNTIAEVDNLTLRRYWLTGITWKFNKSKIKKEAEDDDFFSNY